MLPAPAPLPILWIHTTETLNLDSTLFLHTLSWPQVFQKVSYLVLYISCILYSKNQHHPLFSHIMLTSPTSNFFTFRIMDLNIMLFFHILSWISVLLNINIILCFHIFSWFPILVTSTRLNLQPQHHIVNSHNGCIPASTSYSVFTYYLEFKS